MNLLHLTPEQAARIHEGFDVVEYEYPDGSGGWHYGHIENDDFHGFAYRKQIAQCRVWINGDEYAH
jgi:hypothetical protein